jgi:hypothetical protein
MKQRLAAQQANGRDILEQLSEPDEVPLKDGEVCKMWIGNGREMAAALTVEVTVFDQMCFHIVQNHALPLPSSCSDHCYDTAIRTFVSE